MLSQIDKQIFRSWRQYAVEPQIAKLTGRIIRATGPRIAVVGNCQAFGLAYAMKVMNPIAIVDHFSMIARARASMDLFVKTLDTYDYIFSHDFLEGHVRGGDSEELRRRLPRVTPTPAITFAAFHPDLIFIHDKSQSHGFIFGPVGPYHSALALFAFRAGLSVEEARGLFNENVIQAVGYLDVWNEAARELLDISKTRFGVDLSSDLMNWARRGVFMYSNVHPKSFVLFDLAKRMWEKVGLKPPSSDFGYYEIHDLSRAEIFPVYPAIARVFGAQGGYLFKLQNHHIANSVGDFLTLPQYLWASFKTFEKAGAERLANPRVEAWLADENTKRLLIGLARENLKAGQTPTL